jgi:hypothetical protein
MYVALFFSVSAYFFSSALGTACDWTACLEIYCPSTGPNAVPNQGQCLCTSGIWETAENNITTCIVEACPSVADSGAQQDLLSSCCSKLPIVIMLIERRLGCCLTGRRQRSGRVCLPTSAPQYSYRVCYFAAFHARSKGCDRDVVCG